MWQVAVAAAVAGSGLIAKHIFSPKSHNSSSKITKQDVEEEESQLRQVSNDLSATQFLSTQNEAQNASKSAIDEDEDGVFWFSSYGSCYGSQSRFNSKKSRNLGKKICKTDKNIGCSSFGNEGFNQRKSYGKRVSVCLKRRKTNRSSSGKCDSSSVSKDCSSFGWGLGLGIICMMSAGKAEVNKLSSTIEETAKVVHELKSELDKQKPVPCHQLLNPDDTRDTVDTMQKPVAEQANIEACPSGKHPIDTKNFSHLADSGYDISVLTEEQQHEDVEMDQLEAELESELQKLPWHSTETSEAVENFSSLAQIIRNEPVNKSSTSYQSDGVPPSELKNKLSTLLIEQQESHISELESELNLAHSKLQEKEAELRALKECVKRLTEFSLSTVSDEEIEICGDDQCRKLDHENFVVLDNAMVGTKRPMHFRTLSSSS